MKLNMVNTRREFFNVTLDEIKNVVDKISQDEYATMKKNAEEVGEKLRSGFYTKKIMKEC